MKKIEVYDWLRGLAALAVVFGHFKPFGVDKVYFVWSIQAFLLVTVVLLSQKQLSFLGIVKKLGYTAFCYACLLLMFRPFFVLQNIGPAPDFWMFFFDFRTVFIENPYLGHLWYLLIYFQLLIFLWGMDRWLKKWDVRWVLVGALILSNLSFTFSYTLLERFPTLLLSSWFVTIAAGFYLMPKLIGWMENNPKYRVSRCLVSLMILTAICHVPLLKQWLILPDTRVSLLSTLVYFLCIYVAMESFSIFNHFPAFNFVKQFVSVVSRYTLVIYIYHQGLQRLLAPYGVSMELLTVLSISSGIVVGYLIQQAFSGLERLLQKLRRPPQELKVPYPV